MQKFYFSLPQKLSAGKTTVTIFITGLLCFCLLLFNGIEAFAQGGSPGGGPPDSLSGSSGATWQSVGSFGDINLNHTGLSLGTYRDNNYNRDILIDYTSGNAGIGTTAPGAKTAHRYPSLPPANFF